MLTHTLARLLKKAFVPACVVPLGAAQLHSRQQVPSSHQ